MSRDLALSIEQVWPGSGLQTHTLLLHPDRQALLEAAVRAALALGHVHGAALLLGAGVQLVVLHGSLEEALRVDR